MRTGEALEQSRSLAEVAELDLANAQETVRSARINLAAAERGIFLGDGYNDAPYSEQQISELEVQRDQLQSSAAAQASVLEALDARIRAEQLRVNRLSSASLQANVSGLIWDYLAASGEAVQRDKTWSRLSTASPPSSRFRSPSASITALRLAAQPSFG